MMLFACLGILLHSITIIALHTHSQLPVVDLGYVLQRATSFDVSMLLFELVNALMLISELYVAH